MRLQLLGYRGRQLRLAPLASYEATKVRNRYSQMPPSLNFQIQVFGVRMTPTADLGVDAVLLENDLQGPKVCHTLLTPCHTYLSLT